jgi:energy-coupling factor transporter transmembrane protein EcfT
MTYLILAVIIISTGICWKLAKRKNLKVPFWVVMGACFGPLAIPFALLAKPRALNA